MEQNSTDEGTNNVAHNTIHLLNYPAWIFDEKTLKIVDANQMAIDFCEYEKHELIGLSISELWHGEEFDAIINDLELHSLERSFFGNLKHKNKIGERAVMRYKATRLNEGAEWIVYLFQEKKQPNKHMKKKQTHNPSGFERMSSAVTIASGSTAAFLIALFIIIVWLITGPLLKFSDTWQ